MLSPTERVRHVDRMRANFALEGLEPDATDELLQNSYVSGALTLADLLAYARAYAEKCAARSQSGRFDALS